MKLNISDPSTGGQKTINFEDDKALRDFMDKRISQEVSGDNLGDEYKGYIFRITGGNDKQGFTMKQGVLVNHRVRLLLKAGQTCYRPRRSGERKRKSVRGCITAGDLSVISVVIVKKGDTPLPGITDVNMPRRRGPKRASNIRKLFNLSKEDDVRRYVIRREVTRKNGKTQSKAPKIQRLVTPVVLQRKRRRIAQKRAASERSRKARAEYHALLASRVKEAKAKHAAEVAKRKSSRKSTDSK